MTARVETIVARPFGVLIGIALLQELFLATRQHHLFVASNRRSLQLNKMIKKTFFQFLILQLVAAGCLYADSLTLTTYYPAPNGAYDRLRLVPRTAIGGTSCQVGMMFVNSGDGNKLYICADDGVDGNWQPLVSGSWNQANPGGAPSVIINNDAQNAPIYVGIGTTNPKIGGVTESATLVGLL